MPDRLRGTEQEHNTAPFDSIRYGMRPEQAKDIDVAVCINTVGGTCQDLGKNPRGSIKLYQTTSWGWGVGGWVASNPV